MKLLVLAGHHVHELLTYRECAEVMREALAQRARGQIQQPLRTMVRLQDASGFMALMPAYSPRRRVRAEGLWSSRRATRPSARTRTRAGCCYSTPRRGSRGRWSTRRPSPRSGPRPPPRWRPDLLARPGAAEVAIIGTGVQGRAHAHALAATRELTGIRLAGRDLARTRAVAAELAGQLDVPVSAYDDVAAAVAGAAIVVTATSSAEPVLRRAWLAPGTHVNAVGACVPAARELDTATMAEAAVFADSRESVRNEAGDFLIAEREGVANPVRAELGELLTGTAPGRTGDGELTVFESLGLAAEDLAAASYLYEKASRLGAGTAADF